MKRDIVIHHLVALDAQLRRVRHLAASIGAAEELKARLPALLDETCRTSQRALGAVLNQEGRQREPGSPIPGEGRPATTR